MSPARTLNLFSPPGKAIGFDFAYRRSIGTVRVVADAPPALVRLPMTQGDRPKPDLPLFDRNWREGITRVPLLTGVIKNNSGSVADSSGAVNALVAFERSADADGLADGRETPLGTRDRPVQMALDVDEARALGAMMGLPLLVMLPGGYAAYYPNVPPLPHEGT